MLKLPKMSFYGDLVRKMFGRSSESRRGAVGLRRCTTMITAIVCAIFVTSTTTRAVSTMQTGAPDLLVTDVIYRGFQLVIEVQNQGPAQHQGSVDIEVLVKQGRTTKAKLNTKVGQGHWPVFGTQRSTSVDLSKILTVDPKLGYANFIVYVTVDPSGAIKDTRPQNNTYIKTLAGSGGENSEIRGNYQSNKVLPDLVIDELIFDPPYVKARYTNRGGEASGADFRIHWSANARERNSALVYRYQVPPSGKSCETGGLSMNLLGLISGKENEIQAVIDFEDRVRESNETNNSRTQILQLGPKPTGREPTPQANAEGTVTIGEQITMPVVCSYLVTDAKQGRTLYLLPFVPQAQDITDMRLGQILQIVTRAERAGRLTREQAAYLSIKLKPSDALTNVDTLRPRSVRVGVSGPKRSHSVDMATDGAFTIGPLSPAKGDGIVPWSIQGRWPAGKDMVVFNCKGKAQVY